MYSVLIDMVGSGHVHILDLREGTDSMTAKLYGRYGVSNIVNDTVIVLHGDNRLHLCHNV